MSDWSANPFVLSLSKDMVCRKPGVVKLGPNGIEPEISNV
ncbi:hypothetical protein SPHFLASMR4Y_01122 [Sphingorhabdus sp. SMR4y]|nr:hypothetical protein SPHFLASMR4Y_01122 [Sphingorhabdus sp. SMR4y]